MFNQRFDFFEHVLKAVVQNFVESNTELPVSLKQIIKVHPAPSEFQIQINLIE